MDTSHPVGSRRRAARLGSTAGAAALLVTLGLVPAVKAAAAAPPTATAGPAQVTIVARFAPGVSHAHAASVAAAAIGAPPSAVANDRYLEVVPEAQAAADVARLRAEPGVQYAEISRPVHAMDVTPDDPCYSTGCAAGGATTPMVTQGYLQTIGAPQAWGVSKGDGVTVAVLDTGVDAAHPDLAAKIVRQTDVCATDPQCGDPTPTDDNGHGTHVAGIVGASTDNAVGVASLGWNVMIDDYKVLDSGGNGYTADVDTAIYDAVSRGDRVINLSLANYSCQQSPSDCGPDPDEQTAVEYAIAHNVVVVAAAGNGIYGNPGDNGLTYPASYPGVLGVAATDDRGVVAPYSQWGRAADIAAPGDERNPSADGSNPGVGIVSTWNNGGYEVDTGTSMAAPQVAAAAALIISHDPALTAQQVTQLLETGARPTTGGNPINGGLLDVPASLAASATAPTSYLGYDLAGANGSVYSYGSVGAYGDVSNSHLARPVVGEALLPNGEGYWLVASDGGVFSFGQAAFHGSTGGLRLAQPIVGMAATPDGRGYWLVASDGGIFSFGDARFFGSTGGLRLAQPIVGMAATPDGRGYWLVASDGGIFAFGDARFFGSTGGVHLARPVVGMARTGDGQGYWLVASDGGIFAYGDAYFHGSTGGVALARPVVGMSATPDSNGYWLVASDGGVFSFGDARFYGSAGGTALPGPVVAIAS